MQNEKLSLEAAFVHGWVSSKRNHGSLLFFDLRYKLDKMQCVVSRENASFNICNNLNIESVVGVHGQLRKRPEGTESADQKYGTVELVVERVEILSEAKILPFSLNQENVSEDLRLKYRFLDLRRPSMQKKLRLRAEIIKTIRNCMENMDFIEIQTPILTSTSPEGARDYVVPSRIHPGEFYALPQAPQQFKQLLMAFGFEKYYQIAPCFRDEDPRSDRLLGAFYQLDMEMSFATQEDVFKVIESVLTDIFIKFTNMKKDDITFPKIPYREAMERYATDKPDLRNPLEFIDIFDHIAKNPPHILKDIIIQKGKIALLNCPQAASMSRKFFDDLNKFAISMDLQGIGYILFDGNDYKGNFANLIPGSIKEKINGAALIISHPNAKTFYKAASAIRTRVAQHLSLIDVEAYKFCWIVDFPMYELNTQGELDFSHNPFSMPQGGMDVLISENPLNIYAYQYDIVCNGCEISSGAVRNYKPDIMYKAFEIAGYSKKDVDDKFGAMIEAFSYGTPPHAGCAPGIDRLVMLITREPNVREVIAFPLNQSGRDLLMNSPSPLSKERLDELCITIHNDRNANDHQLNF